ncbi:MAG: ARMT1-like domain-containing protein [Thermodesulfovibrionales bacterium]|nr:ARMT1-like domain-containing protein [Thermodesulfovibrionales bacterium]
MKTYLECFPCFLKQATIAAKLSTDDESLQVKVIKGVTEEILYADIAKPPAYTTTFLHRKIRKILNKDPYKEVKNHYNRVASLLYSEMKERILKSKDPLHTAVRLAIAGNVIDFGVYTSINILETIDKALKGPLAIDDFSLLREALSDNSEILYLLDNAGEVVFDKLLIEVLNNMGIKVKAVAKGEPVLNDCTIEDVNEVGLPNICDVIVNGSDCIGTILEMTSEEFRDEFARHNLVISKGQGNFETLSYAKKNHEIDNKKIFYLFQVKCDVVSQELNLPKGSMVLQVY